MKKITLILSLLAFILVSCQNKNAFTIEGNFTENTFEGKTVYLQKIDSMTAEAPTVIDSAKVKNNKVSFKGATDGTIIMGFLSVGKLDNPEKNSPVGTLILEPGKINVTFSGMDVTIGGTPKNDDFNKVLITLNKMAALSKEVNAAGGNISNIPADAEGKSASERMEALQADLKANSYAFMKGNMTNKAGEFLFFSSAGSLKKEQITELIQLGDSTFRNKPQIKALEKEISKVIPAVGQPFADVELMTVDGKSAKLSDYVGKSKCVVIDFWASWCGPCIKEMPNVIKTYATYKAKGLEIVGVSVDDDKQAWTNAIKTQKMTWIQLADASKTASDIYGVNSIPHTIVIDGNGIIVAKDLRGEELDAKIAEVLK